MLSSASPVLENIKGHAGCPSILLPLQWLSVCHVNLSWGVFLAEGRRRAWSRQVKLLCGQSSWQLPANPVGFVFFLEMCIDFHVACSKQLAHAWLQASSDLQFYANSSRRASRTVAEIPVPGKNTPLSSARLSGYCACLLKGVENCT